MHRAVDGAGEQRLFELLGEEPLAAERGQRAVAEPVAGGPDRHRLDRAGRGQLGMGLRQPRAQLGRLGERQRAAARADAQEGP